MLRLVISTAWCVGDKNYVLVVLFHPDDEELADRIAKAHE